MAVKSTTIFLSFALPKYCLSAGNIMSDKTTAVMWKAKDTWFLGLHKSPH